MVVPEVTASSIPSPGLARPGSLSKADIPMPAAADAARKVGHMIATRKFKALNGHSIQDIETWDDDDEAAAEAIAARVLQRQAIAGHGDDAQLLAGVTLALLQDPALYDRVFDTNVRSVYLCLQHQIRLMTAQGGGAIVVNASVSGLRNPNPGLALYSASKAAVISLTRSAAMALVGHRIRVVS